MENKKPYPGSIQNFSPGSWLTDYDLERISRLEASTSLLEFTKQAWPQIEHTPFVSGWYIEALCEHLEAALQREIKNLIINVPPRASKSTIISIMLAPYWWITHPEERFLYASYGSDLSNDHSIKCRRVISSPWYQLRWGDRYRLVGDQNTKERFDNNQTGYRIATSVEAKIMGFGASILICDDPNNVRDGESEASRKKTNDFISGGWSTRLNDLLTGVKIVVQQRVHQQDVSGYLMEHDLDGEWVKLILPMEFEKSRVCKTIILPSSHGRIWQDPRKAEGEVICPERFSPPALKRLKNGLGSEYKVAGQLQQRPSPEDGGLIKRSWFSKWKQSRPPEVIQIIQSWDTAFEDKEFNSYSACSTFGLFYDDKKVPQIILLSMWRGRVEYPELRAMAKRLYNDYRDDGRNPNLKVDKQGNFKPHLVLVEGKASGLSLIQDLRRAGIQATKFDPTRFGDKMQRVRLISYLIQAGKVWLPALAPSFTKLRSFAETFSECCALFPNDEDRDVVDTLTQVLLRLLYSGWITHPEDPDLNFSEPDRKMPQLY
jgi:predicted phage terminase large subunit-like protein